MRCRCGFENAPDARFCGSCRAALGSGRDSDVSAPTTPSTAPPAASRGGRSSARRLSWASITIAAVVLVAIVAGYWWINRPAERYKTDNGGLYPINVNGKFGYMDRSGKTVITPQFDMAYGFSEGLAHVRIGSRSGYISANGEVVITPQFDAAWQFQYGRANVQLGNRFGFIGKDGKFISSPDFTWTGMFSGRFAPVKTAAGALAFVDRSGKIVLSGKAESLLGAGFADGLVPAASGGKWGYLDTAGKWVIEPQYEAARNFADGLAPVVVGGRTGYIDRKGKFVVNPQYDYGDEFYEGLAAYGSGGKRGFIDTNGTIVAEPKFLGSAHFSEGLAPVQTEAGWGFIDRTGKMVINAQFDWAEVFQNGLARVTALGKEAYVTTSGAFVVDPFPGTTVTAERARLAATAAKAKEENRRRIEQAIVGEWAGRFNNDPQAHLTLNNEAGAISATILAGGWRETFRYEMLPEGTLVFTGTSASQVGRSSSSTYSLDTLRLDLDASRGNLNGQYRDAQGHSGRISFTKMAP